MKDRVIFYADDDQDDLEYFRKAVSDLSGDGIELHTHPGGELLLYALDNPPPVPHVVFLDLNMPGLNGFEVLQNLRNTDKHKKLPIVVFSTSADIETVEKSWQLGATYYLPKSSTYSSLKKSIAYILSMDWENFTPTKDNFFYRN